MGALAFYFPGNETCWSIGTSHSIRQTNGGSPEGSGNGGRRSASDGTLPISRASCPALACLPTMPLVLACNRSLSIEASEIPLARHVRKQRSTFVNLLIRFSANLPLEGHGMLHPLPHFSSTQVLRRSAAQSAFNAWTWEPECRGPRGRARQSRDIGRR